jgi:hypothetical protein
MGSFDVPRVGFLRFAELAAGFRHDPFLPVPGMRRPACITLVFVPVDGEQFRDGYTVSEVLAEVLHRPREGTNH